MTRKRTALAGMFALGFGACIETTGPSDNRPLESLPRPLTSTEQDLVRGNNTFALDLMRDLNTREVDKNVFVSPLSISMALGMTYNGAAGNTAVQMASMLGLENMTLDQSNQAYRDLIDLLFGLDNRVEFHLANSIWYRDTYTFDAGFLDRNRRFFDAEVRALDFNSPSAPGIIDAWVKDNTNGRIEEIAPKSLGGFVMFLINALYFKANWTNRFDESLTSDQPFYLGDGSNVAVPLMTHGAPTPVRMMSTSTARVLELPYGGDAFTMVVAMPADPGTPLSDLVSGMDDARWAQWMDGLDSTAIPVVLPKFTLEYKITLNDALKALGMTDAFDGSAADLTGMIPGGGLVIDHVVHKTFVQVDEAGTEAAAVTVVGIRVTSAPPTFRVDRPFLVVIRERFSGTILFMGKILNPVS